MRKSMSLHQAAAICTIVTVILAGCNKIDNTAALTTDEVVPCQIQQMVFPPLTLEDLSGARAVAQVSPTATKTTTAASTAAGHDTAIFTYNTLGNPVSIIHPTGFGDNIFFKYDNANRLTDFIAMYPTLDGGDEWHRYAYDPHNTTRIIADTTYIGFLSDQETITSYEYTELTTFAYDAQNRINRTTESIPGDDTTVTAYTYDSHGNLEGGGSVYDNKINVHRTNKIWMFLDKDYSVNNPIDNGTYTYDQGNLPVTMATNSETQVAAFYFMIVGYPNSMSTVTIGYSCEYNGQQYH